MRRLARLMWILLVVGLSGPAWGQTDFLLFETGPVRPLARSADGSQLYATNIPDARLEIFAVSDAGLAHTASVPVGLEPCAVAVAPDGTVWVVNHLSDSVSIVDVTASPPRVVRTLLVGDEPRDIVFAGPGGARAFITTGHRGQHRTHTSIGGVPGAGDPQLSTASVPRADVWVFDSAALTTTIGGTPLAILSFFADTPRALATSPDGGTVYVAAFHSGNLTTVIAETQVCNGFQVSGGSNCGPGAPGGNPGPAVNAFGDPAPEVGLIVKQDPNGRWVDELDRNWSALVRFGLPDLDVFSIDAASLDPNGVQSHSGVGTILFNMAVNPQSGTLYVTNTEAPNLTRFEGPGVFGGSTVQGHLSEARITIIDPNGVHSRHLNSHIDYSKLHTDMPDLVDPTTPGHSLATPLQMVVSSDGGTLYVAAFGSSKVGVLQTSALEAGSFDPKQTSADYIHTAGGPSGLELDEARNRLYVLTRFDNAVSVIDLANKQTVQTVALPTPEPASVVVGRPFLYDALTTSGNGEASCASCHIFGDVDSLAWDLGNPDEDDANNPQPSITNPGGLGCMFSPLLCPNRFHPMKGPMTTQTLRGLATHGGMHWRGDRTAGFFGLDSCTEPSGAPCNEFLSFANFIVAFEGLVGHNGLIDPNDMTKFTNFALDIVTPPNPVRALDNSLTPAQLTAGTVYTTLGTDSDALSCNACHMRSPIDGFFGTGGSQSFEGETQHVKIPHLRNDYQKVGMFGNSFGGPHMGPQIKGFGLLHDGAVDTIFNFLSAGVFTLTNQEKLDLVSLTLAFDNDVAPIVGQQITLDGPTDPSSNLSQRLDLLIAQADVTGFQSLILGGTVPFCDLIAKGVSGGQQRGWVWNPVSNMFTPDDGTSEINEAAMRALAGAGQEITFTCMPPGSGQRAGVNRDRDTVFDGLDNCVDVPNDGQEDGDGDQIGDVCDNCSTQLNATQQDSGGVGVFAPANGIGDPCECGDTTDDGFVDMVDAVLSHRANQAMAVLVAPQKCDVDGNSMCNGDDVVRVRDTLAELATLSPSCTAAN